MHHGSTTPRLLKKYAVVWGPAAENEITSKRTMTDILLAKQAYSVSARNAVHELFATQLLGVK